jgi:phosphoglycolate phosphatase-like HAD superfamily hydrolase
MIKQPPENVVYVGDARRDVQAGSEAGMLTLVARFGYLGDDDRPETWGASGLVDTPMEIIDWINGRA